MIHSSIFCRAQEALQTARAAETSLANVRSVATAAASAWRVEAEFAEQREARRSQRSAAALPSEAAQDDHAPSENPDRGNADPSPR